MKSLLAVAALVILVPNVLVGADGSVMPDTRYWWTQDADQNGEYNYSTTTMRDGTSIQVANQWGDVPTGIHMTGPYGNTPVPKIDLHFLHNGSGYAEANLTTGPANTGLEPTNFAERDSGKVIDSQNTTLYFSAPEPINGIRVKLIDQYGRSSPSVAIQEYRSSYGRYSFAYSIPTQVFVGNDFDFNAVKSVTFFVDSNMPAGDYRLSVLGILFVVILDKRGRLLIDRPLSTTLDGFPKLGPGYYGIAHQILIKFLIIWRKP